MRWLTPRGTIRWQGNRLDLLACLVIDKSSSSIAEDNPTGGESSCEIWKEDCRGQVVVFHAISVVAERTDRAVVVGVAGPGADDVDYVIRVGHNDLTREH